MNISGYKIERTSLRTSCGILCLTLLSNCVWYSIRAALRFWRFQSFEIDTTAEKWATGPFVQVPEIDEWNHEYRIPQWTSQELRLLTDWAPSFPSSSIQAHSKVWNHAFLWLTFLFSQPKFTKRKRTAAKTSGIPWEFVFFQVAEVPREAKFFTTEQNTETFSVGSSMRFC